MLLTPSQCVSSWQLFFIFLRLGCTSFGGPVAHLGYFHHEFVQKRRWYSEQGYADILALCQFLPGPASSQVGMAIGLNASGYRGAFCAWLGFTLPSALLMLTFAYFFLAVAQAENTLWLSGLKIVALAVVAQALWGMAKSLCPDPARASIALLSAASMLLLSAIWLQIVVMLVAAVIGRIVLPKPATQPCPEVGLNRATPFVCFLLFFMLLLALPIAASFCDAQLLQLFDIFYRAGALVFGGGHVVLPLLQTELVPEGWLSNDSFLAGYGAAQALPGPLFALASYLGAVASSSIWLGAIIATVAMFLPAFLLVFAVLPWWQQLGRYPAMRQAMAGVNAAVVGLLGAALYTPVFTSAIAQPSDLALAVLAFLALTYWKVPPYLLVLIAVLGGYLLGVFR